MEIDSDTFTYRGSCQSKDGIPHGRGTLLFSSGDRFEGRFHHGAKEGKGAFFFSDGSSLSGHWSDDELNGVATYQYPDGSMMVATYKDGDLDGYCIEYDSNGDITARGNYVVGIRHGIWHFWDEFGGHLFGCVSRQGCFTGMNLTYVYPDGQTALTGRFKDGEMIEALSATKEQGARDEDTFSLTQPTLKYRKDASTETRISDDPLLPDVYEQKRVYVAASKICGAGEGLFSKIHASKGEVMSFYNGVRVSHKEVDNRDWSLNSNTISLDDEVVIDVPLKFADMKVYCASLGHKANHSFTPNCKYDRFDHPRFGKIKCIRTISVVEPGDELTVEYGYNHYEVGQEAPFWYKNALRIFLAGNERLICMRED